MEENISQQQSEAVQTPTNNTPNSIWKSKLLLISGRVLLIVLVGLGGFFLGKILSQPKTPPPSTISQLSPTSTSSPTPPTQIPTPTPTTDPIANWKAYTNTKYGYSIKYPADWTEQLKCEGGAITDDYICFMSPDFEESSAGIITGSTVKGGAVLIYEQGGMVGFPPDGFCAPGGPVYISECREITVGNLQAIQRKVGNTQTHVGILKTGKFILFIRAIYNNSSEDEIVRTFNLMLSTFKFLE